VFLAELYLPETGADECRSVIRKAERAAASLASGGAPVRLVRSVVVPGDEMCLLLFDADSAETVNRVGQKSGLAFDRIIEAIG
jgi:hypothetical protein